MARIQDYLVISNTASNLKTSFTTPEEFLRNYENIYETEKKSFLRHYLINNQSYLFRSNPILFEQLTQYIADILEINPNEVKLIGSAKTGFSISPPPKYGVKFSKTSDLDFVLINRKIFLELEEEFKSWAQQYQSGKLLPQKPKEKEYWPANLTTCPNTLNKGFIDINKIPAHYQFFRAQTINQSLYLLKDGLEKTHKIIVKKASLRVYKNWHSFSKQLKINTEFVLNQV